MCIAALVLWVQRENPTALACQRRAIRIEACTWKKPCKLFLIETQSETGFENARNVPLSNMVGSSFGGRPQPCEIRMQQTNDLKGIIGSTYSTTDVRSVYTYTCIYNIHVYVCIHIYICVCVSVCVHCLNDTILHTYLCRPSVLGIADIDR